MIESIKLPFGLSAFEAFVFFFISALLTAICISSNKRKKEVEDDHNNSYDSRYDNKPKFDAFEIIVDDKGSINSRKYRGKIEPTGISGNRNPSNLTNLSNTSLNSKIPVPSTKHSVNNQIKDSYTPRTGQFGSTGRNSNRNEFKSVNNTAKPTSIKKAHNSIGDDFTDDFTVETNVNTSFNRRGGDTGKFEKNKNNQPVPTDLRFQRKEEPINVSTSIKTPANSFSQPNFKKPQSFEINLEELENNKIIKSNLKKKDKIDNKLSHTDNRAIKKNKNKSVNFFNKVEVWTRTPTFLYSEKSFGADSLNKNDWKKQEQLDDRLNNSLPTFGTNNNNNNNNKRNSKIDLASENRSPTPPQISSYSSFFKSTKQQQAKVNAFNNKQHQSPVLTQPTIFVRNPTKSSPPASRRSGFTQLNSSFDNHSSSAPIKRIDSKNGKS